MIKVNTYKFSIINIHKMNKNNTVYILSTKLQGMTLVSIQT